MKKLTKLFGVLTVVALLGISTPIAAQTNDNAMNTQSTRTDDDGDQGKWGLLGLLGLAGLLGLRKNDRVDHRTTSTNR